LSAIESKQNIAVLLEKQATTYGNKPLVHFIDENLTLTYDEFNRAVNRYANTLKDSGIGQGDHVALMLPNCPDFPITWLALSKLGAVTVALNIGYKAQDMEYVLNNADVCALVTHTDFLPIYQEISHKMSKIRRVFTSGDKAEGYDQTLSNLAQNASEKFSLPQIASTDLMNLQYTSGTTGFPKGCMLTHEYWLSFVDSIADYAEMSEEDVFLGVAPFYYIDSQWELLTTIMSGSKFVLGKKYSASGFMKWVRDYDVTVTFGTQAAWTYKQPESPLDKQNKLRFVIVGQFPTELLKPFQERFNVQVRSGYAMTESGPATAIPIEAEHMLGTGTVGKAVRNRQLMIVDDYGDEVSQGEIGELLISGAGMMLGYYNNPDATSTTLKDGWLHTGDLFRTDEDGFYYIVGRKKDMVRRSGENIAAIEVEEALINHPKIAFAAVTAVPDESRNEEVKAYILLQEGETPETIPPEEIIQYCHSKIAAFKVPRYIEYRKCFPMTAAGKAIKRKLVGKNEDPTENCYDHLLENKRQD